MPTTQQILLKNLLTLLEYYKYRTEDIIFSNAIRRLTKNNLIDTQYNITLEYIEDSWRALSTIKYVIITRFSMYPSKQRLYLLKYLIKKISKGYKINAKVHIYIPKLQEYVYFKDNTICVGDINEAKLMSLELAKETQHNIEYKSIIIYRTI